MNKEIEEILVNARKMYKLKNLIRYNNIQKIKDENVLEHTAMVSLIVMDLANIYKFDSNKAIRLALVHDLCEIHLSDIPYTVKQKFPEIKKAIKKEELSVLSEFSAEINDLLLESSLDNSIETKIVKFADIISCEIYANTEVQLGNVGYMKGVLDNSTKRIIEYASELEGFKK